MCAFLRPLVSLTVLRTWHDRISFHLTAGQPAHLPVLDRVLRLYTSQPTYLHMYYVPTYICTGSPAFPLCTTPTLPACYVPISLRLILHVCLLNNLYIRLHVCLPSCLLFCVPICYSLCLIVCCQLSFLHVCASTCPWPSSLSTYVVLATFMQLASQGILLSHRSSQHFTLTPSQGRQPPHPA